MRRSIIVALLIGTVAGGAIFLGRFATADTPDIFGEPEVPGRIVSYIIVESVDGGGATVFCEVDAYIHTRDGNVEEVVEEGARKVPVGSEIVNWVSAPPQPGVEPIPATYDLDWASVYWDESGNLRVGCAPESVVVKDDGTETTVGEEASLASPRP